MICNHTAGRPFRLERKPALMQLSLRLSRCKRRIRAVYAVIALSAVLVAAYGASTAVFLAHSHRQALRDAGGTLESTALSAAIGTNRSLFEIDAMLLGVERMLSTVLPDAKLDDPAVTTVLRQFNEENLAVSDILILDPDGREVNRADSAGIRRDYRGEAFFTTHRSTGPAGLFIGAPEMSPVDGERSIMMSRPLTRDGAFLGVIAAEVPVATFTEFFEAIAAPRGARIALLLDSGVLVASEPIDPERIGREPPAAAGFGTEQAGLIEISGNTATGPRLLAFRRVPSRPLIVSVSRTRAEILRGWAKECGAATVAFALFALTAAILAWVASRALGRGRLAAAHMRRSEARLQRQSTLLQSTLENIGEGLSVFDARGRLLAWNRRFCKLLDLPVGLHPGTALQDILTRQAVRGDFGDGEPEAEVATRLDLFYRDVPSLKERVTQTGRTLQIRRRAMPDGAVLSVYSDITETRASEQQIVQARSQAELANHSKSEFLANMSHELRTPLNAIIGFSEIISNELFGPMANDKYLEYMKDILTSSRHLLSIINDVLDMSKIEAGKLELSKELVGMQCVVADVLRMMQERALSRRIELVSQVVAAEVVIWADERAIKQIFLNLLSNAIKFSQEGGTIVIRLTAEPGGLAVLEVEDHGIGMTEDEQERALQPFGQAKPATTRNYGGTGLGLPITKGLVEAHGGTLTIDSRAGAGTTVRIVLPMEPARRAPEIAAPPWPVPSHG